MTFVFVDIGNSRTRFAKVRIAVEAQRSSTVPTEPTREAALEWMRQLHAARSPREDTESNYVAIPTGALDDKRLDAICRQFMAERATWIVASVQKSARKEFDEWHRGVGQATPLRFLSRVDFPFEVRVREPDRVGIDRLSAAYAASLLKPRDATAIVVDVGTAVTIDAVGMGGAFLGGAILPGIELASRALALGTSQLPQLPRPAVPPSDSVIGLDTEQAITNGVFWGCVGAVSEIVERMRRELPSDSTVYLTGGAAESVAPFVPFAFEPQPDLVMIGMALTL